jgi:hypothetical protein
VARFVLPSLLEGGGNEEKARRREEGKKGRREEGKKGR